MEREEKLKLITTVLRNVESNYKDDPFLLERDGNLEIAYAKIGSSKGSDDNNSARISGSEPGFQARWFTEFELLRRERKDFTILMETNFKGGKNCDLLIAELGCEEVVPQNNQVVPGLLNSNGLVNTKRRDEIRSKLKSDVVSQIKIELKQTGFNLVNPEYKKQKKQSNGVIVHRREEHFMEEVFRYHDDPSISNGECLYVFACFYETNPIVVDEIIRKYGSLLKWLEKERKEELQAEGVVLTDDFRSNCIECYAFRGSKKWVLIDNKKIYNL